ncbi:MAG: NAD(P)/FAD-dependent oxidoreductase [Planctomycetia bacterium]|nr:NAD(P)/FAD-dependent oxidoreductase [Planctomycetia bacterium]
METWDVAVVGAGAAGLLAAARAAERGRRTILLEKNRRAGVKILISGGTRCNITHDGGAEGVVAAFGPNGKWLRAALAAFGPREVRALVEDEGVPTQVEEYGKVFPASGKSRDVLEALLRRLERSGATLACGEPVTALERAGGGFRVATPKREVAAAKVILTTGGRSYAAVGTTGDGYAFAERLGHTIVPTRPALTPLTSAATWVHALSGLTLDDAGARIVDPAASPPVLLRRRAPVLFTHVGLSGPAPMDLSRAVSAHPRPATLRLELDLLPDTPEADLDAWLRSEATAGGKRLVATALAARVPRRLVDAVAAQAALPAARKLSELGRDERRALVRAIKALAVPLSGTLGFDKAEVTAGGVALDEVNPKTMESLKTPGLFVAGELLDLDGWIGGYNFTGAFATGWAAGSAV